MKKNLSKENWYGTIIIFADVLGRKGKIVEKKTVSVFLSWADGTAQKNFFMALQSAKNS